eukprot:6196941-Pleurochrysis_carterae.AAC.2
MVLGFESKQMCSRHDRAGDESQNCVGRCRPTSRKATTMQTTQLAPTIILYLVTVSGENLFRTSRAAESPPPRPSAQTSISPACLYAAAYCPPRQSCIVRRPDRRRARSTSPARAACAAPAAWRVRPQALRLNGAATPLRLPPRFQRVRKSKLSRAAGRLA